MQRATTWKVCALVPLVLLLIWVAATGADALLQNNAASRDSFKRVVIPFPDDNRYTAAKAELGRMLFHDPLLSGSQTRSCAHCHNPGLSWGDGLPRAKKDRVCGFEALLRWQHPTRGMVMPGEFIPVAEEIGLIAALGEWVIQQACSEANHWPAHIKVAVNVSPVQFKQGRLLQVVTDAPATSQLAAERLELEITESVLLANNSGTLETLHAIRKLGVRVSMDDFGTGYSSLSYLRSFPFDKIKIDQSFIRDMGAVEGSSPIIKAIIDICRSMGMITNAEGVETEEQFAQLRIEGCDEVQGYLFSKPVPRNEIPSLIERLNSRSLADRARAGRGVLSRMHARLPAA